MGEIAFCSLTEMLKRLLFALTAAMMGCYTLKVEKTKEV